MLRPWQKCHTSVLAILTRPPSRAVCSASIGAPDRQRVRGGAGVRMDRWVGGGTGMPCLWQSSSSLATFLRACSSPTPGSWTWTSAKLSDGRSTLARTHEKATAASGESSTASTSVRAPGRAGRLLAPAPMKWACVCSLSGSARPQKVCPVQRGASFFHRQLRPEQFLASGGICLSSVHSSISKSPKFCRKRNPIHKVGAKSP